jgi:mxaJ protein
MSRFLLIVLCCLATACHATSSERRAASGERVLRVCADPDNLPYSNRQQQGFENKIADLVARDLHARVSYTWWPQRRGMVRNTLKAGVCDCLIGVPGNFDLASSTQPYYRSSYVFVTRKDRALSIASLDDPQLRKLKIGVQMIGNDHMNSPPAHALAKRGIIDNVEGYLVYDGPAIVDAVARGDVDVAIVWGPQAGYFAKQQKVALAMTPVTPQIDLPFLPFVFDIAMGVRRGDTKLHEELDRVIEHRHAEIEKILDQYGVPRV